MPNVLLAVLATVCLHALAATEPTTPAATVLPPGWSVAGALAGGAQAGILPGEPAPGGGPVVRLVAPEAGGVVTVRTATCTVVEPGAPLAAELLVCSDRPGRLLTVHVYADPRPEGHWFVTRLVPLTTSWQHHRLVVPGPTGPEWKGRQLVLRLTATAGEALVAGVALAPAPAAGPAAPRQGNLLANPGFDIGAGGWYLKSWPSQDGTVLLPSLTAESPVDGPWALRLPGGGPCIFSSLIPFTPGNPYTLSLHMRLAPGTAPSGRAARAFLITPNWKSYAVIIQASELSGQWKRFSMVFREGDQGHPHANRIYARVDANVTVDIDALQVEEGDQVTPYAASVQVGLEPVGDGGFLAPGPAELTAVVGLPGGCSQPLQLTVRGLSGGGDELFSQAMSLPAGPEERRTVRLPVVHRREGVVACQLAVAAADGTILVENQARYAVFTDAPAPNPLVGVDDLPTADSLPLLHRSEVVAARLGLGFRRTFVTLPPGDAPDPRIPYLRHAFAEQRLRTVRNTVNIMPPPDSCLDLDAMQKKGVPPSDEEMARELPRFAATAARTAAWLNDLVDVFEIFNETNIWRVRRGVPGMPPARYVQVLKAVVPAVRAAAPRLRLALNVNGIDLAYLSEVAELGGFALVDVVTVHAYRATPEHAPIAIADDLVRLRALIQRYKPSLELENSEQYYGCLNSGGIFQGEYNRDYCGEDEADITGRTLQTVLHGITAAAPFGQLNHPTGIWVHTPFGTPWLYHNASGMRTIARLAAGVTGGIDVPVHEAVRALLFERRDGVRLVSVNTRVFGERGCMGRPAGCRVFDVDGNPVEGDELAVGYLPVYLLFPAGRPSAEIATALQTVPWRGFAFPVELTARRCDDGTVLVVARNREREAVAATVRWTGSAGAAPWTMALPGSGTAELRLPAGSAHWQDDPELPYEVACGTALDAGRLRPPVLTIPRLEGDVAGWQPAQWLELGEDRLSPDYAPKFPHHGPADLSARVALAWSAGGLHLLVRATDDVVVTGPNRGADAYSRDSVQVYVDQRAAARSPNARTDGGCTDWILGRDDAGQGFAWLDLAPSGRFIGAANATTGYDPAPMVRWSTVAGGWECRATFPPASLAAMEFKPGTVLGISLLINDDDGQGRKQGLTLGPAGTEPRARPWIYKRCQLGVAP